MIRRRRAYKRFVSKVQAEVSADDKCYTGKTVRISEKGFFVRSQKSFREGTPVNIKLLLPEGEESTLRGVVKYARSVNFLQMMNGMGIELTEKDTAYMQFIRDLKGE
jgi:Tfp pilus assembly protein PilZ